MLLAFAIFSALMLSIVFLAWKKFVAMQKRIIADNESNLAHSIPPTIKSSNVNPTQYLDLAEQLINHSDLDGARNYLLLCDDATLSPTEALRLMALKRRLH